MSTMSRLSTTETGVAWSGKSRLLCSVGQPPYVVAILAPFGVHSTRFSRSVATRRDLVLAEKAQTGAGPAAQPPLNGDSRKYIDIVLSVHPKVRLTVSFETRDPA